MLEFLNYDFHVNLDLTQNIKNSLIRINFVPRVLLTSEFTFIQ